jgi:hypothetical protein
MILNGLGFSNRPLSLTPQFFANSWDGNTSDIKVFQERAQALMETLKNTPG